MLVQILSLFSVPLCQITVCFLMWTNFRFGLELFGGWVLVEHLVTLFLAQCFSLKASWMWILFLNSPLCIYGWCNWYSWEQEKGKRAPGTYDGRGRGEKGVNESLDDLDRSLAHDTLLNAIASVRMIVLFCDLFFKQYVTRFMLWKAIYKAISNIQIDQN